MSRIVQVLHFSLAGGRSGTSVSVQGEQSVHAQRHPARESSVLTCIPAWSLFLQRYGLCLHALAGDVGGRSGFF